MKSSRVVFRGMLAVTCLQLWSVPCHAQTVRGVVRQALTGEPLAGTYVVLLDRDSLEVTRALTDPLGAFRIPAPRPGAYRLRTEQIGYRSAVSDLFDLAEDAVADVDLRVRPVLVQLDALFVEGARECRVVGDQALRVLAVWEEARKALQAVAFGDREEHLVHELERFERRYSPSYQLIREQRATTPTRHVMPFRSRSVEELEDRGYVIIDVDSVLYEAPDAEVFFSVPFLQHHCFWLDRTSRDQRSKIGLRFEPVAGRDRPDVQGVFWLDAETLALERLELGYVNVGLWQRERGAAADVEFARLPDGRWFASRWWIRMPMVQRVESMKGPVWDLEDAIVGYEEEGGVVRRVFAADGRTMYARDRATVRGIVLDSLNGRGLPEAFVRLQGTDYVTISQADGSFWLTDLPEGRYQLTFEHPLTEVLGSIDGVPVTLRSGAVVRADLGLPSEQTIVDRLCTQQPEAGAIGLLGGRVWSATRDSVVAGARVRIVWLSGVVEEEPYRWLDVVTDEQGIYRACVPRDAPLSVEVTAVGVGRAAEPVMFGERWVQIVDVALREAAGGAEPSRP